ncbi:MAG: ABC transporter ATP-binding protein [archaeon]
MILRTKNLSKRFGNRWAVDNLNLHVEKGQIFGFLGPNGAGKSTTIRILLSLIKPTTGEFAFFGEDFRKTSRSVYARIGALVEKPDFYLFLSARRNLQMLAGISGGVPNKRIDEVLEIVKLADRANDRVKSYSHGMKQRLGIAQSIINHPEIIILDEPTNGLDPEGIKEIRELVLRLAGDFGITIFLSSHLLHEIEQTCSHMAIIDNGKLVVQGEVHGLLRKTDFYITEVQVNDPQRAMSLLEKETWIQKITPGDGVLKIQIPAEHRPRLTRFLVENEFAVSSVIPRTSLEDYYLTLLNRDVK